MGPSRINKVSKYLKTIERKTFFDAINSVHQQERDLVNKCSIDQGNKSHKTKECNCKKNNREEKRKLTHSFLRNDKCLKIQILQINYLL